jgi:hypothetical protein
MEVTSIAILPLKDGATPEENNTYSGKLLQARLAYILESAGAQRCYWGRGIEKPELLYLIVDWDTLQDHLDFMHKP